ncbi:MAG TPA: dienelactone hydrolase family protein [Microbacteriaceae bacterium]|nr:dienelactone hydrolase family protein [Microbacteriaceae bacterium]
MTQLSADAAVWLSSDSPQAPLALLLHGYGSNERDLAGLAPSLPSTFRYVALRAPLAVQTGWSWFPLSVAGGRIAATGGRDAAREVARWAVAADVQPVGAIGFSQGGALTLELLREGVIPSLQWGAVLSGFVLEGEPDDSGIDPRDSALSNRRPPVFWGRGDADPVVSPELVGRTLEWLPAHCDARIELYPGLSHSVSAVELSDLSEWLSERAM